MTLVLFDIDGTLLLSQHAGAQCMHDATRELYGDAFTFDAVVFPEGMSTSVRARCSPTPTQLNGRSIV